VNQERKVLKETKVIVDDLVSQENVVNLEKLELKVTQEKKDPKVHRGQLA